MRQPSCIDRLFVPAAVAGCLLLTGSAARATTFGLGLGTDPNHVAYDPNQAVGDFDIEKFAGKWFEIARYRELNEAGWKHTFSTYTYLTPTRLHVQNEGDLIGALHVKTQAELYAPHADRPASMVLKYRDLPGLTQYAAYNVIALADDYSWAIVGEPTHKHLWILGRTASLPADTLTTITTKLADELGYPDAFGKLRCTKQPMGASNLCEWYFRKTPL